MSVYSNPYSSAEINFSLDILQRDNIENLVVKNGMSDVIIEIKGVYYSKNSTGEALILTDINELKIKSIGGDLFDNFLNANLDRNKNDETNNFTLLQGVTGNELIINDTDAINIMRTGGNASLQVGSTKNVVSYTPNLNFRYRLKKDTDYLITNEIVAGTFDNVHVVIYGKIIFIKEGD